MRPFMRSQAFACVVIWPACAYYRGYYVAGSLLAILGILLAERYGGFGAFERTTAPQETTYTETER